ncbi:MAG: endonuclease [Deltaproteobacteria bacterium]|nr:endonuclease [Deltaproteobacteria bacterium]
MALSNAEIDDVLRQTLDDRRLSRTEKRALKEVFADLDLDDEGRAYLRHRVFDLIRELVRHPEAAKALAWAEDVIKLIQLREIERDPTIAEVHFSPGDECRLALVRLLRNASKAIDICVFTITDDRLAEAIMQAHERGVVVRIITDNDKAEDRGSDIYRMGQAGVRVRVDLSEHHMHHKFAIFDRRTLVTGSYNWTRSAAEYNRENLVVSDDAKLVVPYQKNFDEFWDLLGPRKRA